MLHLEIDNDKAREMKQIITRLVRETHRSLVQAMTFQAVMMTRSAIKLAVPAPKYRPVLLNPRWTERDRWIQYDWKKYQKVPERWIGKVKEATPLVIESRRQPRWDVHYIPVWKKNDLRRQIGRRGLAQKSFRIVGAQLASMKSNERSMKFQHRLAETVRLVTKENVYIRVRSMLSYIEKAFPKLKQQAWMKSVSATRAMLNNLIGKKIEEAKTR